MTATTPLTGTSQISLPFASDIQYCERFLGFIQALIMSAETALAALLSSHLPPELRKSVLRDVGEQLRNATVSGRSEASLARLALAAIKKKAAQVVNEQEQFVGQSQTLDILVEYVLGTIREAAGNISQLLEAIQLCGEDDRLHKAVVSICASSIVGTLHRMKNKEEYFNSYKC